MGRSRKAERERRASCREPAAAADSQISAHGITGGFPSLDVSPLLCLTASVTRCTLAASHQAYYDAE
jgi:hypothetical protein